MISASKKNMELNIEQLLDEKSQGMITLAERVRQFPNNLNNFKNFYDAVNEATEREGVPIEFKGFFFTIYSKAIKYDNFLATKGRTALFEIVNAEYHAFTTHNDDPSKIHIGLNLVKRNGIFVPYGVMVHINDKKHYKGVYR